MQLRDGDLDHIVDDLSDDEGDEELGRLARIAQEREDDRFVNLTFFCYFYFVILLLRYFVIYITYLFFFHIFIIFL